MVRYSKPLQNEYKYMRIMTKKKYRQYVKERQGDRQSFDMALIRTMVKMNSEADISDEMFEALLIDEFIAHSIPSYYMQNAELKDFLLETECTKDFAAVREFVLEHGVNFEDSNNGGYMTLHVRVPGETDAYTFMLMTSKEVVSIVIMTMHGLERKVYILNVNSRGVAHDELKLILNLIYYCSIVIHSETDGDTLELETVDAYWVVLVVGAWVAGKDTFYGLPLTWGEIVFLTDRVGDADLQGVVVSFRSPTCRCIGVRVGKGKVGLDVQNGCAVHQVGTLHVDYGTLWGVEFYSCYPNGRETDVVGTER